MNNALLGFLMISTVVSAPNDGATKKSIMLQLSTVAGPGEAGPYSIEAMKTDLDHLTVNSLSPIVTRFQRRSQ